MVAGPSTTRHCLNGRTAAFAGTQPGRRRYTKLAARSLPPALMHCMSQEGGSVTGCRDPWRHSPHRECLPASREVFLHVVEGGT